MKKNLLLALAAIAGLGLASCGNNTTPSTSTSTSTAESSSTQVSTADSTSSAAEKVDVSDVLATFDKTLTGTVKVSYTSTYTAAIDAHGATSNYDSFARDSKATSTIEMDLTEGAYYLKVTTTLADSKNTTLNQTVNALLYKNKYDGKYYYKVGEGNEILVADADALNTLKKLLLDATRGADGDSDKTNNYYDSVLDQLGGVSVASLLYNTDDLSYELENVGISGTFTLDDFDAETTYEKKSDGGIKAAITTDYVAYRGDSAYFDLHSNGSGASVETDNKGHVTSFTETYTGATVDMPFGTPAPTVTVTGERKFTATYGDTLEKFEGTAPATTTVTFGTAENGTFQVYDLAFKSQTDMQFEEIQTGGTVKEGNYIAIKPAAASGYEVDKVTVNDVEVSFVQGGYYLVKGSGQPSTVKVTFKVLAQELNATVTYGAAEHGTYTVKYFNYNDGATATQTEVATGGTVNLNAGDMWLAFAVTPEDGYELDTITVNGKAASQVGIWAFHLNDKTVTEYNVVVTFKASTPVSTTDWSFTVTKDSGVASYTVWTMDNFDTSSLTDVTEAGTAEAKSGRNFCVKVTTADGYEVDSVKIGDTAGSLQAGYYCFAGSTASANEITITTKSTSAAATPTCLYAYTSTANNYAIQLNIYDDATFTITCPGFNNAVAVSGTYTKAADMSSFTFTTDADHIKYFTATSYEMTLAPSGGMTTLVGTFFDGESLSFAYKAS